MRDGCVRMDEREKKGKMKGRKKDEGGERKGRLVESE